MANIYLDFRPDLQLSHTRRLRETIATLSPGDRITVVVERNDAHHTDALLGVLEEKGSDYMVRSWHDGSYHITAVKPERPR